MTKKLSNRLWALLAILLIAALACSPFSILPGFGDDSSATQELQITETRISILESFPVQVQLSIEGQLPNSCMAIASVLSERIENTFQVEVKTQPVEADCSSGPIPFQEQLQLDVLGLPAGDYQVVVEGVSQSFTLQSDNFLATEPADIGNRIELGQGVSLIVPEAVGGTADLIMVPSQASEDNPMPFANYPDRLEITFPNYPIADAFHEARIELYPLPATIEMNEAAAETVNSLHALLDGAPAELPNPLPFLPIFNAGSMIQTQEEVLANERVEGVRFLTQFGQALYPINNHDLFYTFQGFTADGAFYVLAVLPASHPDLPPTGEDFLGMDPEDFFETADTYFAEMKATLDEQPSESFSPELLVLDEMLLSLQLQ